jgi:hypothetical protein
LTRTYPCQLDGQPGDATIGATELVVNGRSYPYVDLDDVRVDDHRIHLTPVHGAPAELSHLARNTDEFVLRFRTARASARRAALLQWTGDAPLAMFESHGGDEPITVVLFADGLVVEPLNGAPQFAPFSLIDDIERDGYRIKLVLRGAANVTVEKLGSETDLFLQRLATARNDLVTRTAKAYAALDDALSGFPAPDGWAVDRAGAGPYWGALRSSFGGGDRADQIAVLEQLSGESLRLGIKASVEGGAFRFALAPVGSKVAVEGGGDEARATFVFATDDVDRLNAVLLLTSFRREAISLPEDSLGRWALAVRTLESVQWARKALVARVVHDDTWGAKVEAALHDGQ